MKTSQIPTETTLVRTQQQPAIYLDHHATTPVDPRVAQVVYDTMTQKFGNAASVDHIYGQIAAKIVEEAAAAVADLLGTTANAVRFTTGATEAIRIALGMASADVECLRVGVSRVEHKAVLEPLMTLARQGRASLRWIDVDGDGQVSLDDVSHVVDQGIDLLCMMAANNEIGTIYPIKEAAAIAAKGGAQTLVDATPAVGRIALEVEEWDIDYLAMSAHKLYGPKGAGALIGPLANSPLADEIVGHAGTLNVPAIVGFGEACRLVMKEGAADQVRTRGLRDRLEAALLRLIPNLIINGDRHNRLGNNLHVSAPGAPNEAVLSRLHNKVAISTGAACSSGAQTPSHVLQAMKLLPDLQESALRISFGKFNTVEEIDFSVVEIAKAIADVRAAMRTSQ